MKSIFDSVILSLTGCENKDPTQLAENDRHLVFTDFLSKFKKFYGTYKTNPEDTYSEGDDNEGWKAAEKIELVSEPYESTAEGYPRDTGYPTIKLYGKNNNTPLFHKFIIGNNLPQLN